MTWTPAGSASAVIGSRSSSRSASVSGMRRMTLRRLPLRLAPTAPSSSGPRAARTTLTMSHSPERAPTGRLRVRAVSATSRRSGRRRIPIPTSSRFRLPSTMSPGPFRRRVPLIPMRFARVANRRAASRRPPPRPVVPQWMQRLSLLPRGPRAASARRRARPSSVVPARRPAAVLPVLRFVVVPPPIRARPCCSSSPPCSSLRNRWIGFAGSGSRAGPPPRRGTAGRSRRLSQRSFASVLADVPDVLPASFPPVARSSGWVAFWQHHGS